MDAYLYEPLKDRSVKCKLCRHRCIIQNGRRGICHVRENKEGVLNALVYGKLIARHVDPIEKKPFFHLLPGSLSYSIAAVGCNFKCLFCQNADIAQMPSDHSGMIMGDRCTPEEVVDSALRADCKSIAYTYTEPTVNFEFAVDTARLARDKGLLNVFVSNGYMTPEALRMISPCLDAANVDLKAFDDAFYKRYCGARLEPVRETLIDMKAMGIFVEVTTLLIPGLNDHPAELERLAAFLAESLGAETPWHISRFHPTYRLTDRPPTPLATLAMARDIGIAAGLQYVYLGNVPGKDGESTYCPRCGQMVIERWGFSVRKNFVENGLCRFCGARIAGVGLP